jgi:oligopeptide/dipeptide ABC transporter ATP-binding protein
MRDPVLEGKNLRKVYPFRSPLGKVKGTVKAVNGVDFVLMPSEILGLVGESGCGKSTLARLILRLEEPSEGRVYFKGQNIHLFKGEALREFRKRVQIIFQDPFSSLNPRMKVGSMLMEPLLVHHLVSSKGEAEDVVAGLLEMVGLSPSDMEKYPHQFSGGERQRVGIARALLLNPLVVVADEPTSSLDVFVQAQVINILLKLMMEKGLSYLFISHNLNLIGQVADRIMVLYLGQVVEVGPGRELIKEPLHPYTRLLVESVPLPDPEKAHLDRLPPLGDVPSPINPPTGCSFHPRCPRAGDLCSREEPMFRDLGSGRKVACHKVAL